MFPNLTPDEKAQLIRAGQDNFRRTLASESIDSAKRLSRAYGNVIKATDKPLRDLKLTAQEKGMTSAELASSKAALNLRDSMTESLDGMQSAIEQESQKLASAGANAGVKVAVRSIEQSGISTGFGAPSTAQMQAMIGYVDSPAFQQILADYGEYHAQTAIDIMLSEASLGKNPLNVARDVVKYVQDMPLADAQRMTRTVQVWSARRGQQVTFQQNSHLITGWIWVATLVNSCPACIAMHGTKHSLDEILNGHHLCKCSMVPITVTWEALGFSGGIEPTAGIQMGEEWFRTQPEKVQQKILGKASFAAWKDGAYQFGELSKTYQNAVYGPMRGHASLDEIIGKEAASQYKNRAA